MNHKSLIHTFLEARIQKNDIVVDMTCGNGHDTYFLAQRAKKVYAIDLQASAISATKKHCQSYDNVEYFNMNHNDFDFNTKIDGAVYNLGYLPKSDKTITTQASSTVSSLEKLLKQDLKYLSIASYRGHDGGMEEYNALKSFLDSSTYSYTELRYSSKNSPVSFLLDFVNPSSSTLIVDDLRLLPRKDALRLIQSTLGLS